MKRLSRIAHTRMETAAVRRVRARGLQANGPVPVGRVPSRGVELEIRGSKLITILLVLIQCAVTAPAEVTVEAHFNLGKTGNVTYAPAPAEIVSQDGNIKLRAVGAPVFNAEAPMEKAQNGDGCVLFGGKGDGYTGTTAVGQPTNNCVLEVWVKARTLTHGETRGRDIDAIRPVVSNGGAGDGYTIAQRGKQWVLLAGRARVVIGDVILDQWTHLAAVRDGTNGTVWRNGKQVNTFIPATSYAPHFAIAVAAGGNPPLAFNGDVYEVRCSTFQSGAFNPQADFLLYYAKARAMHQAHNAQRAGLVQSLESAGPGKEVVTALADAACEKDWLVEPTQTPCRLLVEKSKDGTTSLFQLNNGLVSRTFYLADNLACVSYKNLSNEAEYIRAIKPEARIRIDGTWYEVGGLKGQPEHAYLLRSWYTQLENAQKAFTLSGIETSAPIKRYEWAPRYNALKADWPPKGLHVTMIYQPAPDVPSLKAIEVRVHYEIYQGIPVIAKWFEVLNSGDKAPVINSFESEVLAVNQDQVKRLQVVSDYSFADVNRDPHGSILNNKWIAAADGPFSQYTMPSSTTLWTVDPDYNTWATQNPAEDKYLDFPHRNLLLSRLPAGPEVAVARAKPFTSYITFELLHDSDDRERCSLGFRRMYRKLAPQVTESFLNALMPSGDKAAIKHMLDQMAELKMERLETIGPGAVAHNNLKTNYVAFWKEIADYAKARGIVFGAYELQITSKRRGPDVDCVAPADAAGGDSRFGNSVCIASEWKDTYFSNMWQFYERTGFTSYNVDGPFHGRICASTVHKYHRGLEDSQWEQWKTQVEVLHELCRRGIHIQVPDWYFLNGSAATGMGYREGAANLTFQQQLLLGRQYIYDGTWYKLPTMGWINLHLVGPYAKDPRLGIQPLSEHLELYRNALMQYLGSGCQSGVLGLEVYDTPQTKAVVAQCFDWFRQYRDILTSEIIHVSRPNGRDVDCMFHVNPGLRHKGMVVVFNPTDAAVEKTIKIPVYYTGLSKQVTVKHEGKNPISLEVNEKHEVLLATRTGAHGVTWYLLE